MTPRHNIHTFIHFQNMYIYFKLPTGYTAHFSNEPIIKNVQSFKGKSSIDLIVNNNNIVNVL